MTRNDYELINDVSVVILNYQKLFYKLEELDNSVALKKNEANGKITKMGDPLGEDYSKFINALNVINEELSDMMVDKQKLEIELGKMRESENEYMDKIKASPNSADIMAKVMADNNVNFGNINK